jgi:hypothetical protein
MSNRPELNDEDSRFSSADASGFEIQDIAPVEVTENTYEEPVEVDEEDIAGSVKTKHPMPVGIKIAMGIAATLFVLVIG